MTKGVEVINTISILFMVISNECSEFRKINSINHSIIIILKRVRLVTDVKDPPPTVNVVS